SRPCRQGWRRVIHAQSAFADMGRCCNLSHFFFLLRRRPPSSTLLPYTTLFRSERRLAGAHPQVLRRDLASSRGSPRLRSLERRRSEEHTSELQSRFDLVCRLLLEKKKAELLAPPLSHLASGSDQLIVAFSCMLR